MAIESAPIESASITLSSTDGEVDCHVAHPGAGGPFPAVLFYMDGIGLRPVLYEMADRLAAEGYYVLLPNLFYRRGRAPLFDATELLKPENQPRLREVLGPLLAALRPESAMGDADNYLDFLAAEERVRPGPIGTIGYCFGGSLALRTAGCFPERVAAVASLHGGNLASEAPDSPHLLANRVRAELYFGHADQDASMPAEQIARLTAALDGAGVQYESEVYAGASHGFTMADLAVYNEAAADRHWAKILALFERRLKEVRTG